MENFLKKHTHGIVTTVTVVVLLVFSWQVMSYLIHLKDEPEKVQPKVPVRTVLAESVAYDTIMSPVVADGRVTSQQEVTVSSEVRGAILSGEVPFKKGQRFRKGDVLIRIFDGDTANSLKSTKSAYLQKIAAILPDLKVDFPDRFDTWSAFFHDIDIEKDLPPLPEMKSDQEKIFVASNSILSDYYAIKSSEITLDKHVIRAPFDGSFTSVSVEVGAIANPGSSLASIIRTDSLELEAQVKRSDIRWISIGDEVDVVNDDGSNSWKGVVTRMSGFLEAATQTMSVFVKIRSTKDTPVYQGQYLSAVFPGKPIDAVMEIPRNAVFNANEVFSIVDGALQKREINVVKINETTLLFNGVDEGSVVVTMPLVNAMEGSKVRIAGQEQLAADAQSGAEIPGDGGGKRRSE